MATDQKPPIPRAPIAEQTTDEATGEKALTITYPWSVYLRDLRDDVDNTPIAAAQFFVETQNAAISTTTITTPEQSGYYSFEYYAAITTAAVTSSSLTVVLSWTDGAAKTKTFTAITGNTTVTTGSERYLFQADAASPITYSTTYASNGAGEMVYSLFGIVSSVASES